MIARTVLLSLVGFAFVAACATDPNAFDPTPPPLDPGSDDSGAKVDDCPFQCSLDGRSVLRSCTGEVVTTCAENQACGAALCQEPCAAAAADRSSNGCEFYFQMPAPEAVYPDSCFATFAVNTSPQPVELRLELGGKALDVSKSVYRTNPGEATLIPHEGPIAPGESVILFVSSSSSAPSSNDPESGYVACPAGVQPAYAWDGSMRTTGIDASFHVTTSMPISLVAMYPFGGAKSFLPATTLLLPVVTWSNQHVIVTPWEKASKGGSPTTQIVAAEDGTEVTVLPSREIQDGPTLKGGPAKAPITYRLDKGQYLQLVQFEELAGSFVASTKPTTVFGGHSCGSIPSESQFCDVLWQQIPAFEQWGSEYAAVGYRPRLGDEHEAMPYRIVAARDGTRLAYDPAPPAGAPIELTAGEVVTFPAGVGDAFVVRSQDHDHAIFLAAYMTSTKGGYFGSPPTNGRGDPEFVNVVPSGQWLNSYSFYADPSFPETSLVVVRAKSHGRFADVWLECAGNLTEFAPIGTRGDYEFTRVDLAKGGQSGQSFGDKVCRTGLQRMKSDGPFTATLWGWGLDSSYAYPGGMAHRKLVTNPLPPIR